MRRRVLREERDVRADFPRRHDRRTIHSLVGKTGTRRDGGFDELLAGAAALACLDQLAKAAAADRVEHEMDALFGASVVDLVRPEGVEHPAFAGVHVDGLAAASEGHLGVGDDRDVDAPVRPPVIMAVDVQRD